MQVSVLVKLNSDYDVREQRITESSGDAAFDQSALTAISDAAPFDELNGLEPLMGFFLFHELRFQFKPEDLKR